MSALLIILRATAIFGVVSIAERALRGRASAASRHFVWTLTVVGVLLVPALSMTLPEWTIVVHTTPSAPAAPPIAAPSAPAVDEPTAPAGSSAREDEAVSAATALRATDVPWTTILFAIYATGAAGMLIHLVVGQNSARRLVRDAIVVDDPEWIELLTECAGRMNVRRSVRLLRSLERNVPVALGTIRASIVVPAIAGTWDVDRRRAVLLHEMAHVARWDCLTQALSAVACAMYWFHPGVWYATARLRIERELACDDRVIASGTAGRDYAGHLLEIAYSFGSCRAPAVAVGMARRKQLEGRMLAAMDASRDRSVPRVRVRVVWAAVAASIVVLVGAVRTTTTTAIAAGQADSSSLVRKAASALGISQGQLPGTWEIRPTTVEGTVHLRLVEINSSHGTSIKLDQLQGLTAAQLSGPGGPVQFQMRRDAGTFSFEGIVRNGIGAGTFTFALNPSFADDMAKRGFTKPTAAEQYELARSDVGFAYLEELTKQGYTKPQTGELVRAAQHGVQLTYLQEMGALGYKLGSLDALITLRDHGVSPSYIRDLAQQGYKGMTADELRNARDHGVGPEYVRGMRESGYTSLTMRELINARDHGVGPEYVKALGDQGYRKLPLDEVIRVRDHGVSVEYVRDMRQLGYSLTLPEFVTARDHGVSVEYVREIASLGYAKLPMEALIRLRDHGVSAEYVRALKALGYDKVAADDLITLRDHGLSAERIRAANARAGSRLPIDLLKSLASGGMR